MGVKENLKVKVGLTKVLMLGFVILFLLIASPGEEAMSGESSSGTNTLGFEEPTRTNPLGLDEPIGVEGESILEGKFRYEIQMIDVVSGEEAWSKVKAASQFNSPPDAGMEYILALFGVRITDVEEEPYSLNHAKFEAVSEGGVVYDKFFTISGLNPDLSKDMYEGAEHVGWTYFMVDKDDSAPVAVKDRYLGGVWFDLRPEETSSELEYELELTANPEEGGEVEGAGTYEEGEEVNIEADPAEGCEFVNWTEDGEEVSTNSEYAFEVEQDRELVANFSKIDPRIETDRHSGDHRYETAVEISQASFPDSADAVVLARGDDFPDALAGVPLAYAKDGPLLLTPSNSLHSDTASEIDRLLTEGDTVYVLGGEAAISEEVEDELENDGYAVERLAGANRYDTAIAIAEELPGNPGEAFLTTGTGFADAVATSGVAASQGAPILLTHPESLSDDTAQYIEDNQLSDIHVVGGEAVVSPEVKAEAGSDSRIAGANRWETAVEVAEEFFTSPDTATLATGDDFPDALSGGVYAAIQDAPMLLTAQDELPGEAEDYFSQEEGLGEVSVFGGEAVVSEEVMHTIEFIE